MCISCLWARLDRTQGDMVCVKCAHRRRYAQSDPKVTPKCHKVTSKWSQSDLKGSYDIRKSFGKMCLIWLWADLGAIWGRSEANLHSNRPDNRKTDPKRRQNASKIDPNRILINMIISEIYFSIRHVNSRRFIKPLEYVGEMCVFWKRTFVYTEWLHSDCKVMPNWTNITFISQKWLQSHFKMTPKWPQSEAKAT